jgi:phage-related protein
MGWGSLLKATLKYGGRAAKATASSVGSAVIHPQRTLKGLGTATKTAVVGGAAGYVGWEKLTTDKSVARIVGDAVVGPETIDSVGETIDGVSNSFSELTDSVGGAVDSVNNAMTDVDSKWSGMSNFLRGMFSGNGGDMIGNFFSNLGKGNVSGLSLAGLVLSAFLIFGRFGWLGKIAGAVLGMMMIGDNANMSQVLSGQSRQPQPAQDMQPKQQTQVQEQPVLVEAQPREQIHRGR